MNKQQISIDSLFKKTILMQFDENAIYISRGEKTKSVPFTDVISLDKTSTVLFNRYFWKLIFRVGGTQESVEFQANTTLWNRSFVRFYRHLSNVNPAAITTRYRWWRLL